MRKVNYDIKVCENFGGNYCKKCGEYCVTFSDGDPYKDILIESLEGIETILLRNSFSKKKDICVYSGDKDKLYIDNKIIYYDEKYETLRITASSLYDQLIFLYKETELN